MVLTCKDISERVRVIHITSDQRRYFISKLLLKRFTLEVQITTTADHILIFYVFSEKRRLDMSCDLSVKQKIHMEFRAFLLKKNNYN